MPKPAAPKPAGNKPNVWLIVSIILAIILVVVVVMNYTAKQGSNNSLTTVLSTQEAGDKLLDFVNKIYGTQLGAMTVKGVTEESGLYKVTFSLNDPATGQQAEQPAFVTKDGKKFIPQAVDIAEALTQFENMQQQQQAAPTAGTAATNPTPTPEPEPETPQAE